MNTWKKFSARNKKATAWTRLPLTLVIFVGTLDPFPVFKATNNCTYQWQHRTKNESFTLSSKKQTDMQYSTLECAASLVDTHSIRVINSSSWRAKVRNYSFEDCVEKARLHFCKCDDDMDWDLNARSILLGIDDHVAFSILYPPWKFR